MFMLESQYLQSVRLVHFNTTLIGSRSFVST